MHHTRVVLIGICMLVATAVGAAADAPGAAGKPPAPGVAGKQYVDGRGCVVQRAGAGSRAARRRNAVCGRHVTAATKSRPVVAARPDAAALRAACDRAGGAARAYLTHQGRRYAVRCRARPVPAATAPLRLGITPAPLRIPPGYKPAYPRGRLNPHRGIGTPEGEARMNLIWTQTVPRRLVR